MFFKTLTPPSFYTYLPPSFDHKPLFVLLIIPKPDASLKECDLQMSSLTLDTTSLIHSGGDNHTKKKDARPTSTTSNSIQLNEEENSETLIASSCMQKATEEEVISAITEISGTNINNEEVLMNVNNNEKSETDLLLNEAANVLKDRIRNVIGVSSVIHSVKEEEAAAGGGAEDEDEEEDEDDDAGAMSLASEKKTHITNEDNVDRIGDKGVNNSNALVLHNESNQSNSINHGQSVVTDESPTSVITPTAGNISVMTPTTENIRSGALDNFHATRALVLHSSSSDMTNKEDSNHQQQQKQRTQRVGLEPTEIIHDKAFLHCDGPSDPPGESPNDCPIVSLDIVPHNSSSNLQYTRSDSSKCGDAPGSMGESSVYSNSYNSYGGNNTTNMNERGGGGCGRMWSNVTWVDPKIVRDEHDVDYNVLRQYEELTGGGGGGSGARYNSHDDGRHNNDGESMCSRSIDPPSSYGAPPTSNASSSVMNNLLSNPRTRIATISSGYKKANYFVREDLDTRIYFHQIEDAIGYMAKRGYVKMRSDEEKEWKVLLGRAHGVVKVRYFCV